MAERRAFARLLGGLKRLGARRKRVPFVPQMTQADCGAACLAMVLGLHGKRLELEEARGVLGAGRDGADARGVLEAARWFGLRGRGVRVKQLEDLRLLEPGAILHWRFQHFVVLERPRADGARIVDPAHGRRWVSRDELDRCFTGIALLLEPGEDLEPETRAGRRSRLGRYLGRLRREALLLGRTLVTSVLLQLFVLAVPVLTGLLVDRVVPYRDHGLLLTLGVGLGGLVAFHLLASLVRAHLLLALRTRLDAAMTLGLFEHLAALPYRYFQERSRGDLLMRLNSNATIREMLTSGVMSGMLDGILVLLYLGLIVFVDLPMGLLAGGLGVAQVLLFVATRRRQRDLMSSSLELEARSRGYQVEVLSGMETLKACGAERRAVEQWSNLFVDVLGASLARGRLTALVDSLLESLRVAAPLVILFYGAVRVLDGDLTLGTMLALSGLAMGFLRPLAQLVTNATELQLMGSYLDRVEEVFTTPRERTGTAASLVGTVAGRITLRDVGFRYGPRAAPVLVDVSLEIPAGGFVALVGPSGAGKSTLGRLLIGLLEPTEGEILFDGRDVAELDLHWLRRHFGIVPQEPHLFSGSIRRNIGLTAPDATLDDIVEAARRARLHDDIAAMPMGYDTPLGDGGSTLSGGQRQRLALARALVHRPAVMVLDEATSALDTETERRIQRELEALDCTRIVIAHRLSTIRGADQIVVLSGGRIAERGTHRELVRRGGAYRRLIDGQLDRTAEPREPRAGLLTGPAAPAPRPVGPRLRGSGRAD